MELFIEQFIKDTIEKMGIEDVSVKKDESSVETIRFVVETPDASILIGNKGEHLRSLNFVVRRAVNVKYPEENKRFIIDVGDYQKERVENIKYNAKVAAERTKFLKEDLEMEPMSSYERMIVHKSLEDDSEIKTESTGVGKTRRVVIKYQTSNSEEVENEF